MGISILCVFLSKLSMNSIGETQTQEKKTTIILSIPDKIGGLTDVLQLLTSHQLNMLHIESRPSTTNDYDYDFFIELENNNITEKLEKLVLNVKEQGIATLRIMSDGSEKNNFSMF